MIRVEVNREDGQVKVKYGGEEILVDSRGEHPAQTQQRRRTSTDHDPDKVMRHSRKRSLPQTFPSNIVLSASSKKESRYMDPLK